MGRPPRGGRGLKHRIHQLQRTGLACRPPRGGRGLKPQHRVRRGSAPASPSARGAWIETFQDHHVADYVESPSARGAWIETDYIRATMADPESPSARGAWIETSIRWRRSTSWGVALRAGGVD